MEENLSLSTRQKALGIVLILLFLGAVTYFIYSRTTWFPFGKGLDNAIKETSYSIPAGVEDPMLSAVLFCDFSLPECRQSRNILEQFQSDLPNDLSITYALFHTTENGRKAAIAIALVSELTEPLIYQDFLYDNQDEWYDVEDPVPSFVLYARQSGINDESFEQRLIEALQPDSHYDQLIQKTINKAASIGVTDTPTIFINNQELDAELTYDVLNNYWENKGSWVEPSDETNSSEQSEYENFDDQLDAGLSEEFEITDSLDN